MLKNAFMPAPLQVVFFFCEIAHLRMVAFAIADKVKGVDMSLDNMYFFQRRNNQKLQIYLLKKFKSLPRAFVASSSKSLVYRHKTKTSAFAFPELQAKLISQRARQNSIG